MTENIWNMMDIPDREAFCSTIWSERFASRIAVTEWEELSAYARSCMGRCATPQGYRS